MITEKMMTYYTIINAMTDVLLLVGLSGAQVLPTRCGITFNNRGRKKAVWSFSFGSDLESEEFNDETATIGGSPWEMSHNYLSIMTLYTIIFQMMTHRLLINEAMIIELMIV